MKWFLGAAGVRERVPVLVASPAVWRRWRGDAESEESFASLEGVVGPIEVDGRVVVPFGYEGGIFDVGVGKGEIVILQHLDGDEARAERYRTALARGPAKSAGDEQDLGDPAELTGYLAGELTIAEGLLVGNSWKNGAELDARLGKTARVLEPLLFFAPLAAGTYLVLEGRSDDEDLQWYRIRKGKARDHAPRPPPGVEAGSEVAWRMARASFEDPRAEAAALETARELVELGRPDLALELCDKASPARRVFATWTRVFALAALDREPLAVLRPLVEEWLAPATSAEAANQTLTKKDLLAAVAAVEKTASAAAAGDLRRRLEAAPAPDVFVAEGGDFF